MNARACPEKSDELSLAKISSVVLECNICTDFRNLFFIETVQGVRSAPHGSFTLQTWFEKNKHRINMSYNFIILYVGWTTFCLYNLISALIAQLCLESANQNVRQTLDNWSTSMQCNMRVPPWCHEHRLCPDGDKQWSLLTPSCWGFMIWSNYF